MATVNFSDAFGRWHKLATEEHERLKASQKAGAVVLSWEALDHVCGLAVESGMKALMLKENVVSSDSNGDFPRDTAGRRPHVDELWALFMSKTGNRTMNEWIKRLSKAAASTPTIFDTWRAEHRYAPDGTIGEPVVSMRMQLFKALKAIAQEEGL